MEVRLCLKSFIFYYPIGYRSNSGGHTETFYFPIKLFIAVAVHKARGNCQHRQSVKYYTIIIVEYCVVIVLVNTNNVQCSRPQCTLHSALVTLNLYRSNFQRWGIPRPGPVTGGQSPEPQSTHCYDWSRLG